VTNHWKKKNNLGFQLLLNKIKLKCWKIDNLIDLFNNIINNISAITWRLVLLVEETEVPGENHRHATNHWQPLSHNVVSSIPPYERDSNSHILWWYHSYDNSSMLKIKLCLPTIYCCSRHFVANKKENVSCRN
jgi:hypothetical protein